MQPRPEVQAGPGATGSGPGRSWLADLPAISPEIVTDCLAFIDAFAPETEAHTVRDAGLCDADSE